MEIVHSPRPKNECHKAVEFPSCAIGTASPSTTQTTTCKEYIVAAGKTPAGAAARRMAGLAKSSSLQHLAPATVHPMACRQPPQVRRVATGSSVCGLAAGLQQHHSSFMRAWHNRIATSMGQLQSDNGTASSDTMLSNVALRRRQKHQAPLIRGATALGQGLHNNQILHGLLEARVSVGSSFSSNCGSGVLLQQQLLRLRQSLHSLPVALTEFTGSGATGGGSISRGGSNYHRWPHSAVSAAAGVTSSHQYQQQHTSQGALLPLGTSDAHARYAVQPMRELGHAAQDQRMFQRLQTVFEHEFGYQYWGQQQYQWEVLEEDPVIRAGGLAGGSLPNSSGFPTQHRILPLGGMAGIQDSAESILLHGAVLSNAVNASGCQAQQPAAEMELWAVCAS